MTDRVLDAAAARAAGRVSVGNGGEQRAMPDEPFVEVPLRPRFYQASAFFPLPIVLVSTRGEDGAPNLAPYSLLFPDPDPAAARLHLACRASSNTARNLVDTGRAALCFVPDEPAYLEGCRQLSRPGDSREKMRRSIFALAPSTRPAHDGRAAPDLVREAVQVFECALEVAGPPPDAPDAPRHFTLRVERVLLKSRWQRALEEGSGVPRLPVDYGFRAASATWLSAPRTRTDRPRLRPRYETVVPLAAEAVIERFRARLQLPTCPVVGAHRGRHLQLDLPPSEKRLPSPQLDLEVEPHPEGALVRARVGPNPHLWTLFVMTHAVLGILELAGVVFGVAQLALGEAPSAFLAVPIGLLLHAFVAGAAYIGQGLSADEVYRLRAFVDETLAACAAPPGPAPEAEAAPAPTPTPKAT